MSIHGAGWDSCGSLLVKTLACMSIETRLWSMMSHLCKKIWESVFLWIVKKVLKSSRGMKACWRKSLVRCFQW